MQLVPSGMPIVPTQGLHRRAESAAIADLIDDPYRSLAGFVRKRGGFVKTEKPYVEFAWADFFRTRVRLGDWDAAIARAGIICNDRGEELAWICWLVGRVHRR
jgi:hypothetical protein